MLRSTRGLWQAVQALEALVPFTKRGVESVFGPLKPADHSSDESVALFTGGPVALSDGVSVANVDLRLGRTTGAKRSFLVLTLDGVAVDVPKLEAHIHGLRIAEAPDDHTPEEPFQHSTTRAWGQLRFSFKEQTPDRLVSVVFDPD